MKREAESMMQHIKKITLFGIMLLFAGCTFPHPPLPTDPRNPLKHVAVLPFKNDTVDVDGPNMMRNKMVEALQNRSYVVKDLKETDQILRDRMGITLGGQVDLASAQKFGEELGVEGILTGTLMDFDELTTGVVNVKKVRGKFKLVDTHNGQAVWARGLGVKAETRMEGGLGKVGALATRAADASEKEVPWVLIESTTSGTDNAGKSLLMGVGTRLAMNAIGKHLDRESTELARRITDNLPWGPGSDAVAATPAPAPKFAMPEIKTPEPPSFGYMEWEGKRDFSAIVYSTSLDKNRNEPFTMEMPIAIAGNKIRMDMDMSKKMKGDTQSPLSKMATISRGDKKVSYTLYPNKQRFLVHTVKDELDEKPKVEKTKVGSEMIGNHPTDKYKVRITNKDGRSEEGFIWNAKDLDGMTIKSEVENKDFKITTELRDIILKTPSASLFEIPEGYTESKSFMELMMKEPNKK